MGINTISNTLTLLGRIFDTQKARKPIHPDTSMKPAYRPVPIHQPLPRVSPEEVGLDSEKITAFLKELRDDETLNMQSVLILKNGKIVTEAIFGDTDPLIWKQTFSAAKSITALAIGMLCDEGKLSLDTKLTDVFERRLTPIAKFSIKDLTVRHLLTMTTGASFNEAAMLTEWDWVKGYFAGTFTPGEFSYNSLNSYILSAIVQEKTGERLSEYLTPRLFAPLGIDEFYWETCPMGIDKGGWGLYMRPEDMAKIGVLVMENGMWKGKQLIPHAYLEMAAHTQTTTKTVSKLYDYGYHIWTGKNRDSFLFNGMLGQNVLGFRESGVILVSNAGNDEIFQSSNYFTTAERYFSEKHADTLPRNEEAFKNLQDLISRLKDQPTAVPIPAIPPRRWHLFRKAPPTALSVADPLPPECNLLSGVRFETDDPHAPTVSLLPLILQVVQNNYGSGFKSLSFLKNGSSFYMTYAEESASYLLPIGFGTPAPTDIRIGDVPYHVKTLGQFVKDEDGRPILKIRISFSETPLTRYLKLYYGGIAPQLKQYEQPGGDFVFTKIIGVKHALALSPIIGGTLDKIDNDYVRYRVNKAFAPVIRVNKSE